MHTIIRWTVKHFSSFLINRMRSKIDVFCGYKRFDSNSAHETQHLWWQRLPGVFVPASDVLCLPSTNTSQQRIEFIHHRAALRLKVLIQSAACDCVGALSVYAPFHRPLLVAGRPSCSALPCVTNRFVRRWSNRAKRLPVHIVHTFRSVRRSSTTNHWAWPLWCMLAVNLFDC